MNWQHGNKEIKSLTDTPKEAIGFVYKLTLKKGSNTFYYIGKKNLYSITNPTVSKKRYDELKKAGYPVMKKRTKDKKSWIYKLKNVKAESNWKSYESSSKEIGSVDYKIHKKEILTFCYSDFELKYKEVKEIICSGALETEKYLNAGVSLRMFGNYIQEQQ